MRATYLATVAVLVATLLAPEAEAAGRKRQTTSVATPNGGASKPSKPGGSKGEASRTRASGKTRAKTKGGAKAEGKADGKGRGAKRVASSHRRTERERERERDEDERERSRSPRAAILTPLARIIHCPGDMVAVAGRVCVDRFELHLVDDQTHVAWSPFYPPDHGRAQGIAAFYEGLRAKESEPWLGALLPLPRVPERAGLLRAISEAGVIPQGHLTADEAEGSCRAAGKRLCSESEWLTACRGDASTDFPYGTSYRQGACNVYRESHPSWLLHGNAARYHDDPRNNLVATDDGALLRKTGATAACASRWGDDAIYDMVGNLDEWVADAHGVFAGGFYSRPNKAGCFARVSNHPRAYSDYSTGARCCADPLADG